MPGIESPDTPDSGRHLARMRFLVLGMGVAGISATRVLGEMGARWVTVEEQGGADFASTNGVDLRTIDAVMASASLSLDSPAILACQAAGLPIWSETEFAWRTRATDAPWVLVTGTHGKTKTTHMVGAIARAAGIHAGVCGNTESSVIDAARADHELVAVEISSVQLHFTSTVSPEAAVCLNVETEQLERPGSRDDYQADVARVYRLVRGAAVYPARDKHIEAMVEDADVVEGCRAVGITRGAPSVSQLGVVDGILLDRAFGHSRHHEALEIGHVSDLQHLVTGEVPSSLVTHALSAASLVRAVGAPPEAVGAGLRAFRP